MKILSQPPLGHIGGVRRTRVLLEHAWLPWPNSYYLIVYNCIQHLDVGVGIDPKPLWKEVGQHDMVIDAQNPQTLSRKMETWCSWWGRPQWGLHIASCHLFYSPFGLGQSSSIWREPTHASSSGCLSIFSKCFGQVTRISHVLSDKSCCMRTWGPCATDVWLWTQP